MKPYYHLFVTLISLVVFFFVVLTGGLSLNEKDANSASKYLRKSRQSETIEQFTEPLLPDPGVFPDELIDFWFTTGFSNFSLKRLNFILPSFIKVSPESKLTGDLKWGIEGLSVVNIYADVHLTGIRIKHRALAAGTTVIPDLKIQGIITWNHRKKILSFQNLHVGRKNVVVQLTGQISYKKATVVSLNLYMPNTEIQSVLNAIPSNLIPKIKGAQVQGNIGMDITFLANPARPQSFKLEPNIAISNYALLMEPPGLSIFALKADYIHKIRKNGLLERQIFISKTNPEYITFSRLGENVRQAILKAEDGNFFRHSGFDLDELREAMVQNLKKGKIRWGGSTITMQLAKNLFLDGRRTLSRKLQEAMITYVLEQELTKERILEIYANIIEWGVGVYGISEAAEHYFSKAPTQLTKKEAALLASIIPNPRKRDFKQSASIP